MIIALDIDKDGVISAVEIENAVAALKTLDKNTDGKLTEDEMRPPRPPRGSGRGGRGPGDFMARIMEHDKNKDGKLSKDELPEERRDFYIRLDTNKDGVIEKAEIEEMIKNFGGDEADAVVVVELKNQTVPTARKVSKHFHPASFLNSLDVPSPRMGRAFLWAAQTRNKTH